MYNAKKKKRKEKKNPGNTKSAYWNNRSEVQHTHTPDDNDFSLFFQFKQIKEEMNKKT